MARNYCNGMRCTGAGVTIAGNELGGYPFHCKLCFAKRRSAISFDSAVHSTERSLRGCPEILRFANYFAILVSKTSV
jgi:hypothetical protein